MAIVFILLSLGSAIYVSTATLNYLRLFPALNQVQFQVDTLTFNQSALAAQVRVSNPTDYSGLRIRLLSVILSFFVQTNSSITLFTPPNGITASQQVGATLGPKSVYSFNMPIQLTTQNATMLTNLNRQYPGQVTADVQFRVDIVTFLESVTGSIPFTQTQDILLQSS